MSATDLGALYKIGNPTPEDHPWSFGDTWAVENVRDMQRLVIAPKADHVRLIKRFAKAMPEPMWLLYVLVVPRGTDKAGRYQSRESQSREQVELFLNQFSTFLESDGRHNLWIRSVSGSAMLVYDRHNLIYGYGHLEQWKTMLQQFGMSEGPITSIQIPNPHSHHYHAEFDAEELRILSYWDWHCTPLLEEDE
jgi:hypothetical protein